jgi:hypothetical protein
MRGSEEKQIEVYSYIPLEDRIPAKRPIRPFKAMVNEILLDMGKDLNALYAESGRPSIAPEYLLRASILQILYTIRSERALMVRLDVPRYLAVAERQGLGRRSHQRCCEIKRLRRLGNSTTSRGRDLASLWR